MNQKYLLLFLLLLCSTFTKAQNLTLEDLKLFIHNDYNYANRSLKNIGFKTDNDTAWITEDPNNIWKSQRWTLNEHCVEADNCDYYIVRVPLIKTNTPDKFFTFSVVSTSNHNYYLSLLYKVKDIGMTKGESTASDFDSEIEYFDSDYRVTFKTSNYPDTRPHFEVIVSKITKSSP